MSNDRPRLPRTPAELRRMKLGIRRRLMELRGERILGEIKQQRSDLLAAKRVARHDEEAVKRLVEDFQRDGYL